MRDSEFRVVRLGATRSGFGTFVMRASGHRDTEELRELASWNTRFRNVKCLRMRALRIGSQECSKMTKSEDATGGTN